MTIRRGRLTRVERLPAGLAPAIARAFDGVVSRQNGQDQILAELNAAVAAAGVAPISRSGFNRYAARVLDGAARRPPGAPEGEPSIPNRAHERTIP